MSDVTIDQHSPGETDPDPAPTRSSTGPLAPYRFALSLGFAAAVGAGPLLDAVHAGGEGIDSALLRALGAATVMWFPTGIINRLLATGEHNPS